ncbi:MAG: hypothetical protein KJP00_12470 [Bacteroidia bacterium]|nr:hypothetical protein [Bacteroidia bacterium]
MSSPKSQCHPSYCYLSFGIAIATFLLYLQNPAPFSPFLGTLNPLFPVLFILVSGYYLLSYLESKSTFYIYQKGSSRNYIAIIAIAMLFGVEVIIADIWFAEYPRDINVAYPQSLLFYPVMGFIAEIIFHLIPIALIVFLLSSLTSLPINRIIWIAILVAAVIEPLFQVRFAAETSMTTMIYTAIHVFLFSLIQLIIFKYLGFIAMYATRIVFYIVWHIAWGHFRLELLF